MNTEVQVMRSTAIDAAPATQDVDILSIISRAVADPNVDVAKMREMFELKKDFEALRAKQAFAAAMNKCQTEIEPVFRESSHANDSKKKYAKYEAVDAAIRPIYTKHGFSLSFGSDKPDTPGNIKLTCVCRHSMGHEQYYEIESGVDDVGMKGERNKTIVQGTGSTSSYLRRYLTAMIFNVVYTNEDNDGATGAGPKPITADQRQALVDALGGPGERVTAFCAHHGLNDIGELASDSFDIALAQIKAVNLKRAAL